MMLSLADQKAHDVVYKLFKDDNGDPFDMTLGQISLFRAIYEKQSPRLQFDCYTQYGKSDVVSMAVLLRATTFPEKWVILGASHAKAGIIMSKLIKHIFENDYCLAKFDIGPDESLERIKRDRSKENVTFKIDESGKLGRVMVLSADARKMTRDAGDILIGHGAENLIEDDAALIPDPIHGKALRMLGGFKTAFLLKITNSFGRNHAYRSSIDPNYKHLIINYKQGIEEGRVTQEFIQEMREALDPVTFGSLYECVYPPAEMIGEGGWMSLLTDDQINEAQTRKLESIGLRRLGVDVAEGVNYNVFVTRSDNVARVHLKNLEKDLMKTADTAISIIRELHILPSNVFIDAIGIGAGVSSRVRQLGLSVNGIKVGTKATEKTDLEKLLDPNEFMNLRAEAYWKMRTWILQGGALEASSEWKQLTTIRYRTNSDKRIQIMSKEEMKARGLLAASESTDVPDALSLTFVPTLFKELIIFGGASEALLPYYPEVGI